MSTIRYADKVRCDYPNCQSEADVKVDEATFSHVPAPGWLALTGLDMTVMTPFGQQIRDLCSLHSGIAVDKLAAAFRLEKSGG